jgi:hypothetical protein
MVNDGQAGARRLPLRLGAVPRLTGSVSTAGTDDPFVEPLGNVAVNS